MKLNLLLAASAVSLIASAGVASAYIHCNQEGDCWHSEARIRVPGITFESHPDDWYFHRHWDSDREHHWRDTRAVATTATAFG